MNGDAPAIVLRSRAFFKGLRDEIGHLLALPVYQLALPFMHEAWRQLEYTRVLAGTTL